MQPEKIEVGIKGEKARHISRVLSWTVIHLGSASPQTSCDLPEPSAGST